MHDILTITLNPAVDLATSVAQVIAGPKLRCKPPRIDPGGGGVNVARAIRKLGGDATALVAVGGSTGARLCSLLEVERIAMIPVAVSGETRESFAVTDESTGAQFRFGLPGDVLTQADCDRLIAAIAEAAPEDGLVVLSGSVPPGLPIDIPARIQAAIAPRACRLIVDTAGPVLAQLIAASQSPVHLLRIDQKEAAEAAEHPMDTVADSVSFAQRLVSRGIAEIVVTGRGAEGSIMVTQDGRFFCHAAHVPVRSKIGAGDAFVGSMTLALARDKRPEQALQRGVAAASATVGTEGTALCELAEVEALLAQCRVEPI